MLETGETRCPSGSLAKFDVDITIHNPLGFVFAGRIKPPVGALNTAPAFNWIVSPGTASLSACAKVAESLAIRKLPG